ncbi:hypothetical protein GOP47_0011509 [Adiantum capillus-veneris]|uniref:Transcriptional regulator SLK2 n=1 Tax=Adiantum capillus-veneris TaxID=13818 RepID=A0A9D4ZHX9_ADICA|nr:hypothetical protein GOP47_0011509 [Adiantum capillus-veneris]
MDSGHRAGSSSVTPLSVAGSVQGQNISPASLLRSSNGSPSTLAFPSLTSPRTSFSTDLSMLGNLNSAGNAGTFTGLNSGVSNNSAGLALPGPVNNSGLGGVPSVQRSLSVGAESLGFAGLPASPSPLSFSSGNLAGTGLMVNSLTRHGSSRLDHQELQHLNAVSMPQYSQDSQQLAQHQQQLEQHQQLQQQQQQQLGHSHLRNQQSLVVGTQQQMQGLAAVKLEQQLIQQQGQALAPVKMEPQTDSPLRQQAIQGPVKLEQVDASLRQQLQHQQTQTLASHVKLEQVDASLRQQLQHQQVQALQGVGPVKLDVRQQHEQPLHAQLSLPKLEVKPDVELPNSLVQQSLLTSHMQRQEALQLQRQQSQQFHMSLLQQQRILQHKQLQQQLRQQLAGPAKPLVFEPGICARRLMQYMFKQRQRPQDNDIHFWRRFVGEFFAHGAKKRWCVSQYGNNGRQTTGVFPQDVWHCEICGSRPGRGFETTVEVLPRLCKIKYDSGILDELLFVDISNEYRLGSGFMVLEYGKAIQESIFEQLRVVREGQLRIIFTPELKIHLWEFCARGHEELLPRRLLVPQVTQLAAIAQKYQNSIAQNQNGATSLTTQDLQTNCQLFVAAAKQLTRTLEAPTVNDLGYTKRYVRCLQISEVVNSMKDLIDFSREKRIGPIASLLNFPRRTGAMGSFSGDALRQQEHTAPPQALATEQTMASITSTGNSNLTGPINTVGHAGNSRSSLPSLLHQNAVTPLQNSMQMNGASPSINTSSNEVATSSLSSSQRTYLNSLQKCHPSLSVGGGGGGQPTPLNTFSHVAQQNSLSSAVNLLQQSSGQFLQGNPQERENVAHQIQDLMMTSQLRAGTSHHQQQQEVLGGVANAKLNAGVNASMVSGAGSLLVSANGLGNSNTMSEALGGGDGPGMGSAVSDSDSGNLGGVTSSFSDGLMNTSFLSGNGNNMMSLGSSLSVNNTENMIANGAMHGSSAIAEDQSLSLQDPNQSFLNDYGGNDILSSLGNPAFSSLPYSWKSP